MALKSAPQHPGKILYDQVMVPLGVSRNKLARDIDVPVGRISDIVNGKRGVTPDTALRLSRYFGTEPELWMRLQWEYDLYVARATTWPSVAPRVRIFDPSEMLPVEEGDGRLPGADPVAAGAEEYRPSVRSGAETDDSLREDSFDRGVGSSTEERMAAIALALEMELSRRESDTAEPAERPVISESGGKVGDAGDVGPVVSSFDEAIAPNVAIEDAEEAPSSSGGVGPEARVPEFGVDDVQALQAGLPDASVEQGFEEAAPEEITTDPVILLDSVDADMAALEDPEAQPQASGDKPSRTADEDPESLEIPDPDNLRYRVTSE